MKFHRIGIAKRLILARKFTQAKSLLRSLADKNHAEAQLLLGYLFYGGDPETTMEDAQHWLEKSADNRNAEAIALLASIKANPRPWRPVRYNGTFLSLTRKAANMGSAEAQRSLACAYAHGDRVPQDNRSAMFWDEKAARQGLAESQNDLALMLLLGMGGEVDLEGAIAWYKKSASEDSNVPYAQWAAEALSQIFGGTPYRNLAKPEEAEYWRNRAQRLTTLSCRPHPDWFYK